MTSQQQEILALLKAGLGAYEHLDKITASRNSLRVQISRLRASGVNVMAVWKFGYEIR